MVVKGELDFGSDSHPRARLAVAETALATVPQDYRGLEVEDLLARDRDHVFFRGMHVGWAWGFDPKGREFLDFLSEHRMAGVEATRFYLDGTTESIPTPCEVRLVSDDPVEDSELERRFVEQNRSTYADLRARGLLPSQGQNLASQDITELLITQDPDVERGGA